MKKIALLLLLSFWANRASAQLDNPGFDDPWIFDDVVQQAYPAGWEFYGTLADLSQPSNYCYQITPAQQGSYALGVSVWYYYVKTVALQKAPVTTRPATVEGYYKYTDNEVRSVTTDETMPDTAIVSVWATKWNDVLMQADTIGQGQLTLPASAGYSHFVCPVTYTGNVVPDSITIAFDPSMVRRFENVTDYQSTSPTGKSSYLTIDSVVLGTPLGINGNNRQPVVNIFPNPASDFITVETDGGNYTISIVDMLGKTVQSVNTGEALITVPLAGLASGVYNVVVAGKQQETTHSKFIKQ